MEYESSIFPCTWLLPALFCKIAQEKVPKAVGSCVKLTDLLITCHFLSSVKFFQEKEGRLSIVSLCPAAHRRSGVEKHRDVIHIVSLPPLSYSMSASLTSLPFGVPIPLSASLSLSLSPFFSLHLLVPLMSGYRGLSCDIMFDEDDIRYEYRAHCNCYFPIIKISLVI